METLQQKVQTALLDDPRTKDAAIEVLDSNGVITLAGIVPTQETSEAAEEIAREADGVATIVNEIQVKARVKNNFDGLGTFNEDTSDR
jgi:osmotically-inducible protein OsmY